MKRCHCGDCLSCEMRDFRSRVLLRRTSARQTATIRDRRAIEANRLRVRAQLAAGATPEALAG